MNFVDKLNNMIKGLGTVKTYWHEGDSYMHILISIWDKNDPLSNIGTVDMRYWWDDVFKQYTLGWPYSIKLKSNGMNNDEWYMLYSIVEQARKLTI